MARAHHTTLPQSEPQEKQARPDSQATDSASRGGATETWLVLAGVLMMLAGVALVAIPSVLPQYTWAVRGLATRGVTSLPIAIGGVLMCGIAFAGRSSRRVSAPASTAAPATATSIEELSQQVAHLGDGLQGVRIEFVYLKDALQSQLDRVESARTADNAGDAVYRLAASLDQVGMRMEERVGTAQRELAESIRAVSTAIETLREGGAALRTSIEEVRTSIEEMRESTPESQRYAPESPDESYAENWEGHGHEDASESSRLGLLDMLDDLGRLLPQKSEIDAATEIEADPFEASQDEGWKQAGSIPAALPNIPRDELRLAEPAGLLGRGMARGEPPPREEPLGEKLEELRDLLADSRVREALAALEKSRR